MDKQEKRLSKMNRQELLSHYEEMKEIAFRDALTGLLNRGALEKAIRQRLQSMEAADCCALFIVDLDNFKIVNDSMGHQAGDFVIARAARLLLGMFRATDIVGRLGGDEFAVFLCGNLTEKMVRSKGQVICDQLQFMMGADTDIVVTASVGIHLSREKKSFEDMYRLADLALYKAKKSGKQGYCIKTNSSEQDKVEEDSYKLVNAVKLRSLLDNIDSGVAMIGMTKEAPFVFVSPAFAHMLGAEVNELVETSAVRFLHPDEKEEFKNLIIEDVIKKKGTISHVTRLITQNGNSLWCKLHIVQVEYNENTPVILVTAMDVSEWKEKESTLQLNNDLFRIAMNQTAQSIWEVGLSDKTFRLLGENNSFPEYLAEPAAFPEGIIQNGWVMPESAESFRDFAEEIFDGKVQGYANFKIRYREPDVSGWGSFSYRAVFDELGKPIRVVGIIESMEQKAVSRGGAKRMALPDSLMESLILQIDGNLTKNKVERCWIEGEDMTGKDSCKTCSVVLEREMKKSFPLESGKKLAQLFSREALILAVSEQKNQWFMQEYRRIDSGGNICPVSCVTNVYEDTETGELHLALWVNRLDVRLGWEAGLGANIHKDPISKLYTRPTVRRISNRILDRNEHKLCALVLIEIRGMTRLYGQYSGDLDIKWKAIITALLLAMGTDCIPGQFGTERYIFFFPEISGEEALKRKLEQAFLFVRSITADLVDGNLIRFMAGGICRYQNETEYNIMMKKVQDLCQSWSNSSGDRVVFADDDKEEHWDYHLKTKTESDQIRVPREEVARPLSDREKDAAFHCILGILNSDSLEESSRCMLRILGEYYEADRAYILVITEHGRVLTMPHEWTANNKRSIQQVVSGTLTAKIPVVEQCARENRPVFLTRKTALKQEKKEEKTGCWHFAAFPMRADGKVEAYLCIENPRHYISDAALPSLLSSCILKERKKYLKNTKGSSEEGSRLDLPNQSSFMKVIYNYNSDVYSSLGVVCIDVPEFSVLNGSQGFEYGRRLLWYISQTMTGIFGHSMLYRTWDAEFVALCPNTTQETFKGKCARLYSALTRRYPKEIRMGRTWSDKVFSGKALVDEAKILMRCDKRDEMTRRPDRLPVALATFGSVSEMIGAGKFTVFFQPEINMEEGQIIGAEALVRGLEDNGNVILPGKFIGAMEKSGDILDLDLFVFDYAMKKLDEWRMAGKSLIPISINVSPVTIFYPRILASVLAIQSRYPEVDPSFLKMEIVPGAEDIYRGRLIDMAARLREYGVSVSVDNLDANDFNAALFETASFETVKLSKRLINDIVDNENNQIVVRDIVDMCHKREIRCVAKGVETKEQMMMLLSVGCSCGQGFYFDRPLTESSFYEKYLKEQRRENYGDTEKEKL